MRSPCCGPATSSRSRSSCARTTPRWRSGSVPGLGVDGAIEELGADVAYPIEELDEQLPRLLTGVAAVYFSLGSDDRLERLLSRVVADSRGLAQRGGVAIEAVVDPTPLVARLRLIKSRDEIAALQRAIEITGAGIAAAMRATRPGLHEYEVQAVLEAEYRRQGSPRDGFPAIVAAGVHACTLHYTDNRARIEPGELLLLDNRRRGRLLRRRRDPHLPGRRPLPPRAARGLRGRARGPATGDRAGRARRALRRGARSARCAC